MSRLPSIACIIVFMLASVSATQAQQQPGTREELAIRTLVQKTEDANNAGDVNAWVSLFAPDAVYMAPGVPAVTSREGLIEIAKAGFRNRAAVHIDPVEIQICGDWAFARSRVSGSVTMYGSGEVVPVDVKQIVIYRRGEGGAWQIARLINNSNRE